MNISKNGVLFIANFETIDGAPNLKAIKSPETDSKGRSKYEIGWGHNSDKYFVVTPESTITYEQAVDILEHDLGEATSILNKWCAIQDLFFTQQQFDAMCSALYNGVDITSGNSGISRALHDWGRGTENPDKVKAEWRRWVYMTVSGKKVKANGLIKRREDELRLFFDGEYRRTY